MGAVLGQKDDDGTEYICVAISRSLGKTERQYASFQGEMLAVVLRQGIIMHMRSYSIIRKQNIYISRRSDYELIPVLQKMFLIVTKSPRNSCFAII